MACNFKYISKYLLVKMKTEKNKYPGKNVNSDLPFESPQTEESKRLSEEGHSEGVERKDEKKKDHGSRRGGNQSVNQS
jgi:hypothetical protein